MILTSGSRSELRRRAVLAGGVLALGGVLSATAGRAATPQEMEQDARAGLERLYASTPRAKALASRALGILVFPKIIKAGFMVGGQTGDGVLFEHDRTAGFFNISAASFGLQIGAQTFGYALFFITASALEFLKKSKGWSIGSGPSVVLLDEGKAASITSTTLTQDVYALAFGQSGLMAGLGIEGSKITQIRPTG